MGEKIQLEEIPVVQAIDKMLLTEKGTEEATLGRKAYSLAGEYLVGPLYDAVSGGAFELTFDPQDDPYSPEWTARRTDSDLGYGGYFPWEAVKFMLEEEGK